MDYFITSRQIILETKKILDEKDLWGTPFENYFAQYLLLIIYAELENSLKNELRLYFSSFTFCDQMKLTENYLRKNLGSLLKKDLVGFLGSHMNEEMKEWFKKYLNGHDEICNEYDSMIIARHKIAHTNTFNKSYREIINGLSSFIFIQENFIRVLNKSKKIKSRKKYFPLQSYLELQKLYCSELELNFSNIEFLIKSTLPVSARTRVWWSNSEEHSQAKAWIESGWRVEEVDFTNRVVTFQRVLN